MPKIAVVNDDTEFLTLMCDLLTDRGWKSYAHRESNTAYDMLKREQPDLAILDIRMGNPESGWQIVELLTLDPETRHMPIIVSSAAIDELESKKEWLAEHNISILPKPFDIDDLYCLVERALGLRGDGE